MNSSGFFQRMNAVIGTLFFLSAFAAFAQANDGETASQIAQKSRERGSLNLVDLQAEMKLATLSKDGKAKEQVLTGVSRKISGRIHSLSRFTQPPGVAGVSVLTVEGKGSEKDAISIYLPKLKRVRQVAQSDRGKAFMDTDFSYADLSGTGARDEYISRLADAQVNGRDTYVLTGKADETSPYGKVVMYVDKETYVPMRVDYSDKDGQPFKKYQTIKLKRFGEKTVAAESTMENLKTGSKTTMLILKLEPAQVGDDAFSERALERG